MRYLIDFKYDGTLFNGYQVQPGLRTVQEEIEKAVSFMNGKSKTRIHACSRTDKGVHAINQFAHFDMDRDIPLYKIKSGLNSLLPDDIYINSVSKVDDDFHSRYMAKSKEYIYKVNISEYDPLNRNYCYQLCKKLDIDKMIDASKYLIGEHDFRSFVDNEDTRENSVRKIYNIDIKNIDGIAIFSFIGNGFMKYQVRNMVGALIDVGLGKKDDSYILELLNNKSREKASKCVPGCGLYLNKINY